jgi:hypothetical protein
MALVVPDEGERKLLEYIVNKTAPTNLVIRLYVNDVDLSGETFTTSSFTEANTGSSSSSSNGYASVTLLGANWTVSTNQGVSVAVYNSTITFSFTESQSVYGYYITNTSNNILWAERFSGAPFNLPSGGGDISVRPQVQLN